MFFYRNSKFIMLFVSIFALLVYAIINNWTYSFDTGIVNFAHSLRTPFLTRIMFTITYLGEYNSIAVMVIIFSIYFLRQKRYDCIGFLIIVNSTSPFFNSLLKNWFERDRPNIDPYRMYSSYSFPSGHATASMVLFGSFVSMLWYIRKKSKKAAFTGSMYVLLVGVSRIYLGVHYPTDVIGGYIIGATWVIFFIILLEISKKIINIDKKIPL